MNTIDPLSGSWNKQHQIFLENSAKLKLNLRGKAIHDIRVAIKKLRSYLALYYQLTGPDEDGLELPDSEILFNILGKYRDIEISMKLLDTISSGNKNKYKFFRDHLQNAFKLSKQKIAVPLKIHRPVELQTIANIIKKNLSSENADSITLRIVDIINEKKETTINLIKSSKAQPHEMRRQLKEFYYWLSILPKKYKSRSNLKNLDKILDQLGTWQDHQVLLRLATHYRKDFVPKKTNEYSYMKKLESQIIEISKKILERCNTKLYPQFEQILKQI